MRGRLKAGWTVVLLLSVLFLSSTLAIQSNQEESESSNEGNPISSPPRGIVPAYEQLLSDWVSGYPPLAQLTVTAHDAIFYGTTGGGSVLFEIGANFDVNTTDTSLYIYNAQAYCKVQEQLFTGPNNVSGELSDTSVSVALVRQDSDSASEEVSSTTRPLIVYDFLQTVFSYYDEKGYRYEPLPQRESLLQRSSSQNAAQSATPKRKHHNKKWEANQHKKQAERQRYLDSKGLKSQRAFNTQELDCWIDIYAENTEQPYLSPCNSGYCVVSVSVDKSGLEVVLNGTAYSGNLGDSYGDVVLGGRDGTDISGGGLNTALVLDGTTLVPASTELALLTSLSNGFDEFAASYGAPFKPVLLFDDEIYFCYDHFALGGGSNPFFTDITSFYLGFLLVPEETGVLHTKGLYTTSAPKTVALPPTFTAQNWQDLNHDGFVNYGDYVDLVFNFTSACAVQKGGLTLVVDENYFTGQQLQLVYVAGPGILSVSGGTLSISDIVVPYNAALGYATTVITLTVKVLFNTRTNNLGPIVPTADIHGYYRADPWQFETSLRDDLDACYNDILAVSWEVQVAQEHLDKCALAFINATEQKHDEIKLIRELLQVGARLQDEYVTCERAVKRRKTANLLKGIPTLYNQVLAIPRKKGLRDVAETEPETADAPQVPFEVKKRGGEADPLTAAELHLGLIQCYDEVYVKTQELKELEEYLHHCRRHDFWREVAHESLRARVYSYYLGSVKANNARAEADLVECQSELASLS